MIMPNWVTNELIVEGDKKDVKKFLKQMGDEIDFEKIIPKPENCFTDDISMKDREKCEAEGIPNWYDWCIDNWGTKWNACHQEKCEQVDGGAYISLTYKFDTAWSYPEPIIEQLRKEWDKLEFYGGWIEEGYQSCGQI
tara:strand:- start:151 stop:564 length:414 start_codon:yes stop_codon:yes gene_type:complete